MHDHGRIGLVTTVAVQLRRLEALKASVLAARRARTWLIERHLHIDTTFPAADAVTAPSCFSDGESYEPVDYALHRVLMQPLRVTSQDVVVEIGCGMGRTLCLFARRELRKCTGIELDPELAEIARANARTLRGRRAPIEVLVGDAAEANYTEGTLFWLFNPFGAQTMRAVLERIRQSLDAAPRAIQIVYVNPVHEEVLRSSGWLVCTGRKRSPFFGTYGASYWTNRAKERGTTGRVTF